VRKKRTPGILFHSGSESIGEKYPETKHVWFVASYWWLTKELIRFANSPQGKRDGLQLSHARFEHYKTVTKQVMKFKEADIQIDIEQKPVLKLILSISGT